MEKYTLIITEKPDAAKRIADALDKSGKAAKTVENEVPCYWAKCDRDLVVVPALGHLYTVADEKKGRRQYPVFSYQWVPLYLAKRGAKRIQIWLEKIRKLAECADGFIDACDYDIEGSIIGYCILKYACGGKETVAKRMKYSTLTKEEICRAYAEAAPTLDFALVEAGLTRHEVDWLYGINLSRALTVAVKNQGRGYSTLSTGRVQGPTLMFLAERESNIRSFVPTPYWSIRATVRISISVLDAIYEKEVIETKDEADAIVKACKGQDGKIESIKANLLKQLPPAPFDIGSLQSEAYRLFRYTPMRTLNIAQRLYLDALISYPRTSSQKLPPVIGYEEILKKLGRIHDYSLLATELLSLHGLKPHEGKADDPAHPAIYPTGNVPDRALTSAERNIWDLVVKRFMATFGEPALHQTVKVTININGCKFLLMGKQTLEEGWLRFYEPYIRIENVALPQMQEGQRVQVEKIILEDKFTQPPPRYNPESLLKKMQKEEIGTKATRAGIIQTLYDRKYVRDERMVVTDLGFKVVDILKKYCPAVISPELTRKLEEKMSKIQQKKESKENVLQEAIAILKPVMERLKENESAIGAELAHALVTAKLEERTIGTCPLCREGKLVIMYSRKTGKRFAGCTGYFEGKCKTAFPLPQTGAVKPTGNICRHCGVPTVRVWTKGKKPWILCINPECSTKKRSVTAEGLVKKI
ncbi:MAG: DNA topoisomerase I [Candidatus Bathyarchaeia archaeon]